MRITVGLFLRVEYVRRVIDPGSGIRIRPLINNGRVVYHQYTAAPQKRARNQWAYEATDTVREVKSLGMNIKRQSSSI